MASRIGFRASGSSFGFRVSGSSFGFRVSGSSFGFRVSGWVSGFGLRVLGCGSRVSMTLESVMPHLDAIGSTQAAWGLRSWKGAYPDLPKSLN